MPRQAVVVALITGAALMPAVSHLVAEEPEGFESRTVRVADGDARVEFPFRVLRPAPLEPGARHPVVLFLHGAGERGTDNAAQLKFLPRWMAEPENRRRHPCFLVAPQCRPDHAWSMLDWETKRAAPLPPAPTADLAAAVAALDEVLATEPVDPDRIYLTGLSMGGYGSWDLAARHPERFAAVLPICGGGDEATAARLAALSIWCFHGADDPVVPVEGSRRMMAALSAAGGRPVFSELPGVGHDSWTPAYRNPAVLDWLFAQRRR
ncbi:MAG: prolyl oligopeptidase family serine peptidase [Planctomycetaceae bacterium]